MPAKKRDKKYVKRHAGLPVRLAAAAMFAPMHSVLDQIEEHGTVACSVQGVPMFKDLETGVWCDLAVAVQGLVDYLEMYERRFNVQLPVQSLREFRQAMEYVMPVSESLIARLRADMLVSQKALSTMRPDDAADLLVNCVIRDELQSSLCASSEARGL